MDVENALAHDAEIVTNGKLNSDSSCNDILLISKKNLEFSYFHTFRPIVLHRIIIKI